MIRVKNHLVVQHNNLIQSQYRSTLQEKRLILWLMAQIKPDDVDFKKYTLKISDFAKMVGLENNHAIYKELAKVTEDLVSKVVKIEVPEEDKMIQVSFFSSATYKYGEGSVELSFDPALKPFLLELNKQFTSLSLNTVMNFSSAYSIRIYELLKQYLNIGNRTIKIDELKGFLGIDKEKYKLYAALKNRVIKPAHKEINERSDILVEFTEIKEGKKVIALKFIIKKNPKFTQEEFFVPSPHDIQEQQNIKESNRLLDELMTVWGMTKDVASEIVQEYEEDYIQDKINFIKAEIEKKHISNPTGYLRKALENNWMKKNSSDILNSKMDFTISEFIKGIQDNIWKQTVELLTQNIGEGAVLSWFPRLRFLSFRENKLLLSTNTTFTSNYISEKYKREIVRAIEYVTSDKVNKFDILVECGPSQL